MKRMTLIVLAMLLTGCVKPPVQGRLDPFPADQIHFASKSLRDETAVGTPLVSRDTEGNLLHVTVPIRSASNYDLHIDYRVTFFDKNHQVINQTGWFTRTFTANTPDQIRVTSTSPRAADFQVDFRYAQ